MTELVARLRTCAAHLLAGDTEGRAGRDAIDLLIEASNALEQTTSQQQVIPPQVIPPQPLGEPMAIIPPQPQPMELLNPAGGTIRTAQGEAREAGPMIGTPPVGPASPRTCPKCDSRAAKRVRRQDKRILLICPACGHEWPYVPDGKWG